MKDVIDVKCLGDFRLMLTFEGGERREVDLGKRLYFEGVFQPLRKSAFFRRVSVNPDVGTIVWPNGADICPDVLYEWSTPVVQASEPA